MQFYFFLTGLVIVTCWRIKFSKIEEHRASSRRKYVPMTTRNDFLSQNLEYCSAHNGMEIEFCGSPVRFRHVGANSEKNGDHTRVHIYTRGWSPGEDRKGRFAETFQLPYGYDVVVVVCAR